MQHIIQNTNQNNLKGKQYFIYAYDHFDANKVGINRWHMIGKEKEEKVALERAKNLFQSTNYQKVEVKKSCGSEEPKIELVKSYGQEKSKNTHYLVCFIFSTLMLLSYLLLFQI